MSVLFEACVDSVASAIAAEAGGAGRLELCDSLIEGGVTPSAGKIAAVLARVRIPVNVLVRPRGGDFVYSEEEMDVMLRDIAECRRLGVSGVVIGCLTAAGDVDEEATRRLVDAARPLSVTFHRAIDTAREPIEAFRACIRLGVDRVLSSGAAPSADKGARVLRAFVVEAEKCMSGGAGAGASADATAAGSGASKPSKPPQRPIVLAGGGVTASNAASIVASTGVAEVHGTARVAVPGRSTYRPERDEDIVYMGGERRNTPDTEYSYKQATAESVGAVVRALAAGSS
jgi:copper homeostasis protein